MRWYYLLLLFAPFVLWIAYREWDLGAAASAEPEPMSLTQLIARGPEGNPNVLLTNYVLCNNYVVSQRRGSWESVWVPVVPEEDVADPKAGPVRALNVRAIVMSNRVRSDEELLERLDRHRLPVFVTNKVMGLGPKQRELLEQNYPGTDFSSCLILQDERHWSLTSVLLTAAAGVVLLVVGGALAVRDFVRWRDRGRHPAGY